jgi:hypothetical protein
VVDRQNDGPSIGCVLLDLIRHPVDHFIRRWNWKSAVLSSMVRSTLFFLANLDAGLSAARAAFLTGLIFRSSTAGFYGALTQAFRQIRPVWTGTLAGMMVLPLLFAMRRGALTVGEGSQSLWHDVCRIPRLIADFTASLLRGLLRLA